MIMWYPLYKLLMLLLTPIFWTLGFIKPLSEKYYFHDRLSAIDTRPKGKLIWVHVASLGEYQGIKPLLDSMLQENQDVNILLTSFSHRSAQQIKNILPKRCIHAFLPLDTPLVINKFLNHWSPNAVIWTEQELWPQILTTIAERKLHSVLVNGRVTEKTIEKWDGKNDILAGSLQHFERIFCQDEVSVQRFVQLGCDHSKIEVTGSLKLFSDPLEVVAEKYADISNQIDHRPVWLAASVHVEEEQSVIEAQHKLLASDPNTLLIFCPRQPSEGDHFTNFIQEAGLQAARRSQDQIIDASTQVYIADTMGELGVWFSLAPVAFMGGSIVSKGGHNPIEAVTLGTHVLHGPHIHNFQDAYAKLDTLGWSDCIKSSDELFVKVTKYISDERGPLDVTALHADDPKVILERISATVLGDM